MRIYLSTDHADSEMKNLIKAHLEKAGHDVVGCGARTYDPVDDYPTFCIGAASHTAADPDSLGIVLDGSGNGKQIAANKAKDARCALTRSVETAKLAREHNNAQLIGLDGRIHSERGALAVVNVFVSQPWSGEERHQRHIDTLTEYEKTGVTPELPEA